ncbi:hypothetical protein AZE42_07357 [Rhizopogon vesiculosus]|uniref:Ricin B lectin domain-containing protein n=1 Tax=Rhizopogon vesiculosus TaxID=180088 RepID=A0A1J8Q3T6_9AGAM|nr:hypothetical protein AZE42_07357 [Rhizopogon vesiculosus]
MSISYTGALTNVAFKKLLLTWREGDVVGYPEEPDSKDFQMWKVEVGPGGPPNVTIQNVATLLYLGYDDTGVTTSKEPHAWIAVYDPETATVGVKTLSNLALDLPDGGSGTKVTLVPNAGNLTDQQKWTPSHDMLA